MMPNKIWIMSEAEIEQFQKYRLQKYHASGIKGEVDDSILTKYYTYYIVFYFRKFKASKDQPFKIEKLIHVAVSLFKRFYLLNQYGDNCQSQNALCSIYLSLKINEVSYADIDYYAKVWKSKQKIFLNEDCLHFHDAGYSDKQIYLLRGIGFQIGRSPIIPAIQSLSNFLHKKLKDQHFMREIVDQIKEMLRRVYTDMKAMFLFSGPKLGLAIVLHVIKVKQVQQKLGQTIQEIFQHSLDQALEKNKQQIAKIVKYIEKIQKFDHKEAGNTVKQLREKLITAKKRVFEIPQKKSPKMSPLSFSFANIEE